MTHLDILYYALCALLMVTSVVSTAYACVILMVGGGPSSPNPVSILADALVGMFASGFGTFLVCSGLTSVTAIALAVALFVTLPFSCIYAFCAFRDLAGYLKERMASRKTNAA